MVVLEPYSEVLDDRSQCRVILEAVIQDELVLVNALLQAGVDPNQVWHNGIALVMYARSVSCLQLLACHGAVLEVKTRDGQTGLHYAGSKPCDVGGEWIRIYNDVDIRDCHGETPLLYSISCRYYEFAKLLLTTGADPNARSDSGEAPLHAAALHGDRHMTTLLLQFGASVDLTNNNDETPLMVAAFHDNWWPETVIDILLKGGAARDVKSHGLTALDMAIDRHCRRAMRLLLEGPFTSLSDAEHAAL